MGMRLENLVVPEVGRVARVVKADCPNVRAQ